MKDIAENNLNYHTFVFDVNVTEGVSGLRMNDSKELKVYEYESKIKFLDLPNNYKPGLQYKVAVSAMLLLEYCYAPCEIHILLLLKYRFKRYIW